MLFKKSKHTYIHVDFDCFFASCEVLRNPELKGKKVCVWWEIIIACTYEAKALGVKTGTPIWEAKVLLWKNTHYFVPDHNYYSEVSDRLMKYLEYNTLSLEPFSIDEAFCDITGLAEMNKMSLSKYIEKLQTDIYNEIWIAVSIWVANTRIKAKIYSKVNKPYGICIGENNDQEVCLFKKLPLKDIPYIWKAYQKRLMYRCRTIYDYVWLGFRYIQKNMWKTGTDLWFELCWVNAFALKKGREPKSISRSRSFNKNITSDYNYLRKQLIHHFECVFEEITMKNYEVRQVTVMLRTKSFVTLTYDFTLLEYTNMRGELLDRVYDLFDRNYDRNEVYRSTGIVLSKFRSYLPRQMSIFDRPIRSKDNHYELTQAMNFLNKKYGNHKVTFGLSMQWRGFDAKHSITK